MIARGRHGAWAWATQRLMSQSLARGLTLQAAPYRQQQRALLMPDLVTVRAAQLTSTHNTGA